MKLEHPLAGLFDRCQTLCVAECCGIDAYDFNPIHVASYLLLHRGEPDAADVALVRSQLASLKANYGSAGASSVGVTLVELNQVFSGEQIDALVERISTSLEEALVLIGGTKPSPSRHPGR
jgi:hypothetical protein